MCQRRCVSAPVSAGLCECVGEPAFACQYVCGSVGLWVSVSVGQHARVLVRLCVSGPVYQT